MRTRVYLNLVLMAIVAGLILWVMKLPQSSAHQLKPLLLMPKDAIQRIQISQPTTQQDTILIKQNGVWSMQQPKQALVNPIRMTQLLTLTDEGISAEYEPNAQDLAAFGLLPAPVTLQINQQVLAFGALNPVSKQRYILSNGRLNLVSEGVYSLLTAEPLDWLSLQLLPSGEPIQEIILPTGYRQTPELKQNWQSASALRLGTCTGQELQQGLISIILSQGQQLDYQWLQANSDDFVLCNATLGLRYILTTQQQHKLLFKENEPNLN